MSQKNTAALIDAINKEGAGQRRKPLIVRSNNTFFHNCEGLLGKPLLFTE